MQRLGWTLLLVLSLAGQAYAGFEGYLEMKIMLKEGAGIMKGHISAVGTRAEIDAKASQMGNMPVQMTLLMKFARPEIVHMLNDATKTYVELNVQDLNDPRAQRPAKVYSVKKLGKEKIAGYVCEHLMLTAQDGAETEVWTSKELVDLAAFREYMRRSRQGADMLGMMQALQDAGAAGFVTKLIAHDPKRGAPTMTLDLVKAEKRAVAAALFEIPTGYTKQAGLLGVMPGLLPLPPQQQQTINKALEKLTPEQRKMLEGLLKPKGGQ
ncbi:MAG: DUF4412 domain-containing protein [Candidatus Tectomicrobia bacterium]|uniref:DUF4412 domain-containing protein n=1 Tax=Tectimicrobiota bacterium TaxID=2528274 RepID=A0A938B1S8_UNCTE|nr:DUF4412 domain-containing protein [Candidatus Tectomicrobia bacterium]